MGIKMLLILSFRPSTSYSLISMDISGQMLTDINRSTNSTKSNLCAVLSFFLLLHEVSNAEQKCCLSVPC